jgi:hypothetical protein
MTISTFGFLIIAATFVLGAFWILSETSAKSKPATRLAPGIAFSVLLAMSAVVLQNVKAATREYHFYSFLYELSDCATNKQDDLALKYLRQYKTQWQELDDKDIVRVIVSLRRDLGAERKRSKDNEKTF